MLSRDARASRAMPFQRLSACGRAGVRGARRRRAPRDNGGAVRQLFAAARGARGRAVASDRIRRRRPERDLLSAVSDRCTKLLTPTHLHPIVPSSDEGNTHDRLSTHLPAELIMRFRDRAALLSCATTLAVAAAAAPAGAQCSPAVQRLITDQKYEDAKTEVRALLKRNEKDDVALHCMGTIDIESGDSKGAIE